MPPAAAFALPTPPPCRSNAARSGLVRRGSCCPRGPRTPATRARRAPTECCAASAAERPRPPAPRPPQLPRPTPVPDEVILLLSGGAVGATVGLSVTAFKLSIGLLREFLYGDYVAGPLFDTVGSANLVIIPAMGGIAVAALRAATGPFVGGLSDCIADPAGKVSLPRALQKTLAAVLTLGAGLSLGPEQPCVDIGAVAGQRLAQALRLGGARRELLLACGAAAGLAAGFNAPIAGVFFALERLTFGTRVGRGGVDAAVVLLSASISALVAQAGLGSTPAFEPPLYEMLNPLAEIPMWLVLGLLSGGASVAFRRLLVAVNDFFNASGAMASVPAHVKPLIGASFCGLTALHFPQVLFFGYDTLSALLADNGYFSLPVLLALLFLKPVCTAVCLGSGLVGGTVAPSLFMGAVVGASFQKLSALALHAAAGLPLGLPELAIAGTPAYALLGMASVLGGILRAPLTSSLLLFELTRDYKICAASMISAGIASAVANYDGGGGDEAEREDSAERAAGAPSGAAAPAAASSAASSAAPADAAPAADVDKLLQLGLPFVTPSGAVLESVTVDDSAVMTSVPVIPSDLPLSEAVTRLLAADCDASIVLSPTGALVGLLTLERAVEALAVPADADGAPSAAGAACDGGAAAAAVAAGSSAARTVEALRRIGAPHAVVVGADGAPLGILSAATAERFAARESLRMLMRVKQRQDRS